MKSTAISILSAAALALAPSLQMFPDGSPRAQEAMFWWLSSNIIIKAKWIIIVLMNFILEKIRISVFFFSMLSLFPYERGNALSFHLINPEMLMIYTI